VSEPSLEGCREKQRRGMKHLQDLDAAIAEWVSLETKPYRISGEFRPDSREYVFTGEMLKPLDDLLLWGVMFGDALHNLRSALDHLVWELVRLNTGKDGSTANQFPICDTGAAYWSSGRKGEPSTRERCLRGVSDAHKALIDESQPYRTPTPPGATPGLSVFRELSNHDKHRLVHLTIFAVDFRSREEFDDMFIVNADAGERIGTKLGPLPSEGEAEILAVEFSCPGPNPDVRMKHEPTLNVGIGKSRTRLNDFFLVGDEIAAIIETFAPDFPT